MRMEGGMDGNKREEKGGWQGMEGLVNLCAFFSFFLCICQLMLKRPFQICCNNEFCSLNLDITNET